MLSEVCDFVHNYFEYEIHHGTFSIVNGGIDLTGLVKNGQRFRILGSALNDGIYTYYDESALYNDDDDALADLMDETFTGAIVAMAIPKEFLKIVSDITEWQNKNGQIVESPYTSESFGGYSYTKATGSGSNAGGVLGWRDIFRARLNAYRRIA